MCSPAELLDMLDECPRGFPGWREFEDLGVRILRHLFVPPLEEPHIQARSFSGIDRRDAIFPNRNHTPDTYWGQLLLELDARMVLVEFKNFDQQTISSDEVDQTRNYLTNTLGRFAIICGREDPGNQAILRRNQAFTQEQKVIIFVTDAILMEMIHMKERGEDPARLVMELVELFYIQYE